ncbi:MAG: hypothetical protein WCM93_14440 [Bacteroidota bacterium]
MKINDWTTQELFLFNLSYVLGKLSLGSQNRYDLADITHNTMGQLEQVTNVALELGMIEEVNGMFSLADDIEVVYKNTVSGETLGKTILCEKNFAPCPCPSK